MKPIPECVPDVLRLALDAARRATSEPFIHRKVLARVMSALAADGDFGHDANDLVLQALATTYKALGVRDPYEKEKARRNRAFLGLEPDMAAYLDKAKDRLSAAIMLSWTAAQVDLDVLGRDEAGRALFERLDGAAPAVDQREALLGAIRKSENVWLVLGEAGEIVVDRHLAAELTARGKKVTAVVGSRPVLALAAMEDAAAVNFAEVAEMLDPGAAMYGLSLEKAPVEFRERCAGAETIIAKGEVHFSALQDEGLEFYSFMRARSDYEAGLWNVPAGSGILGKWSPAAAKSNGTGN